VFLFLSLWVAPDLSFRKRFLSAVDVRAITVLVMARNDETIGLKYPHPDIVLGYLRVDISRLHDGIPLTHDHDDGHVIDPATGIALYRHVVPMRIPDPHTCITDKELRSVCIVMRDFVSIAPSRQAAATRVQLPQIEHATEFFVEQPVTRHERLLEKKTRSKKQPTVQPKPQRPKKTLRCDRSNRQLYGRSNRSYRQ
jgi:hypothetical protein